MKKRKKLIPIIAITLMCIMLTVIVRKSEQPLSVSTILKYTPENKMVAAGIILIFFGLKSLTIVFPLSILYLASGILFQPLAAVLVSTIGLGITITIPYWIGKFSGQQIVSEICKKYPKLEQVKKYQEANTFFACFITRIVGFLPGDLVSIYFGTCSVSYPKYLVAGVSGSLLSIITTTLMGEKISNPFSVEFLIALICRIIVSIGAVALNYSLNHRK